ncbi:MAG: GNAT family N-acetyltransferase [Candidatus Bipolaricaulis sp.]|nr:GNAT family N-acetyltransferase [Candidatus Bipolaricaulis sp.]
MKLRIVKLEKEHVEEAARLVGRRCAALRTSVSSLPPACDDPATFPGRLLRLVDRGVGVAAFEGDRMVGLLGAYSIGTLHGRPCMLSPEWGNGAEPAVARRAVEAMYREVAPEWLRRGGEIHAICALAHDAAALEGWAWIGFGRMVCDALRSLDPISVAPDGVQVRRAGPGDIGVVLPLARGLREHLATPPIYVLGEESSEDRAAWEATLRDPTMAVWLAAREDATLGYLRQGPATRDACDVIVDEGTTSITGAYVEPTARGGGVATALLARAIDWGREQGYVRCSVDFETANGSAARFWMRHFAPVVVSLGRTLDPRLVRT